MMITLGKAARRGRVLSRLATMVVPVIACTLIAAPALAGSQLGSTEMAHSSAAPAYASWPTFHGDAGLSGVSADPAISTANAATLGVRWMTHTFGPVLSSPVTDYSATLGETLAYVANETGDVEAINTADGSIVWSDSFGVPIHATPTVFGSDVWFGTAVSGTMIKVNKDTGQVECRVSLGPGVDYASPVIGTPPGGVPTLSVGVQDNGAVSGPLIAINESTCAVQWQKTPYPTVSGSWSPDSFGVNANGVPLVIMGSGDPDCSVYALNADTGATLWRVTSLVGGLNDFGAGAVISPPGNNGIADGMAYIPGKDRILYAIDLTTGKLEWTFNYGAATGAQYSGGRSTAALAGSTLVFGTPVGVAAVDAVTGKQIWLSENAGPKDTEVLSSPLVTGPPGQQVVVYGDLNGYIQVISLATGTPLYSFKTSGYVISSAADSAGDIIIGSSDGFLYDLAVGGSNGTSPTTNISDPADGSSIPNPDGSSGTVPVVATGSATDPSAIRAVDVAVQLDGAAGPWWNAATQSWQPGPTYNQATLSSPGSASTNWSLGVPAPREGGVLTYTARAVGTGGLVDTALVQSTVTVQPVKVGPHIILSASRAAPGYGVNVSGGGFQPGEPVALSMTVSTLATVTAKTNGSIPSTRIRVPSAFPFGPTAVTATGQTSGKAATAPLDVASEWPQFGHDPQRTDYLPNDNVLSQEVTPGKIYRLQPYWAYSMSAPIHSTPAVADGFAFVGDDSGAVTAVKLSTGGLAWSATTGGALDSSPAVDSSAGLVVVGSNDGKVYAFSEKTGAVVWTATTGGPVTSSPLISGGVVYVGSNDHKLYALAEKTGTVAWTASVPGAIGSSPALDPANSTIVVGDGTGAVTAFQAGATSATQIWQHQAGGAVDNSPLISGGSVFIGSADGTVVALKESSGASTWSRSLGSAVTGAMAYQNGLLYVGTANSKLSALSTMSGSTSWSDVLAGPVTGVSVTGGMLFTESSNGTVTGLRIHGEVVWLAKTGAGLVGTPVIVDNAVFVGGEDRALYCYTPFGEPVV
ncbi:MAG TPA: PQQ-binding-like beta-propeller repeat protein [Streptosporangiaceae bacterium]|nr:PQQ-binding-like beta-propeller repeat protein [Streptosporangiaceae bacterium]